MRILTMMDYSDNTHILMCKTWIYLACRFNPTADITVFHHNPIKEIRLYAKKYSNVSFIRVNFHGILPFKKTNGFAHPSQELKLAIWKYADTNVQTPYIYTDSDAFILDSLTPWWSIINQKPFIAIPERNVNNLRMFNAGVYSCSKSQKLINLQKLIAQYNNDGRRIHIPVGDQGLLNAYLQTIQYDYCHEKIDFTYNCFAKWCQVSTVTDDAIVIYSGSYPWWNQLYRRINNIPKAWWEDWFWWNKSKRVKILHAFGGAGFKFWELPECRPLWQYCVNKVS